MPIGMFSHCSIQPSCGMAGKDGGVIGSQDDPRAFYMPERVDASLLWFAEAGYVEYYFANPCLQASSWTKSAFRQKYAQKPLHFERIGPVISAYPSMTS